MDGKGQWINNNKRDVTMDSFMNNNDELDDDDNMMLNETRMTDFLNLNDGNMDNNEAEVEFSDDNDSDMDDEEKEDTKPKTIKKLTKLEFALKQRNRVKKVLFEIADISQKVLTDPYHNVKLCNLVFQLCNDEDIEICQYAMLSLTRIIIDIMPPYRIGTLSNTTTLKAQNEKVRQFEKALLNVYELFLKFVFKHAQLYNSKVCFVIFNYYIVYG